MDSEGLGHVERETGWSRELLYQLVDGVREYAIFMSDTKGRVMGWNVGAELIFGYTAEEAIGQDGAMLFTPEDRANGVPEKEMQTARETGCAEDERWHIRKDGSRFFASGVQTAIYDENGEHTGFAKIARDLTERINLQRELEKAYESVESKVGERTGELSEKNESLRLEIIERKRSEELRVALLRRIVRAQEDERKRLAREIHDNIGQVLVGIQYKLAHVQSVYEPDSELAKHVDDMISMVKKVDSEVDFLAWELRPSILDHLGLSSAMATYVKEWESHFNTRAEFHHFGIDSRHLLPEIEINLYRISQEALNNTAKHAKASKASVILEHVDGSISLVIEDDGIGFDRAKKERITSDDRGMGLLGMRERAELLGGTVQIESAPGAGTTVLVRVPAQFADEAA